MKTGKHGPCVGLCVLPLVVCVVSCLLCSVWRNTWCVVVLGGFFLHSHPVSANTIEEKKNEQKKLLARYFYIQLYQHIQETHKSHA